jgi:hypothetical protein
MPRDPLPVAVRILCMFSSPLLLLCRNAEEGFVGGSDGICAFVSPDGAAGARNEPRGWCVRSCSVASGRVEATNSNALGVSKIVCGRLGSASVL